MGTQMSWVESKGECIYCYADATRITLYFKIGGDYTPFVVVVDVFILCFALISQLTGYFIKYWPTNWLVIQYTCMCLKITPCVWWRTNFLFLSFQGRAHQSSWSTQISWCATARSKVIADTSAVWYFTPSRQTFSSVSLLMFVCSV